MIRNTHIFGVNYSKHGGKNQRIEEKYRKECNTKVFYKQRININGIMVLANLIRACGCVGVCVFMSECVYEIFNRIKNA